jgi:hypothetical protein
MKKHFFSILIILLLTGAATAQEKRDPLKWPFSKTSIWNMPLHDSANYIHAEIGVAGNYGMTKDEDHIVFYNPANPLKNVYEMSGSWGGREPNSNDKLLFKVRIPSGYTYYHATDNNCFTFFTDNDNFIQTQPMQYVSSFNKWTSKYVWESQSVFGDGIRGNHGGAGMSGFGGTVRLGEINPGSEIKHALKVNIFCKLYANYRNNEPDGKPGYRWPAVKSDSGAGDSGSGNYYGGSNPEVQMGTLLALKPEFDISSLRTEPARILAKAMQDYGAYIVDNTAWDVYAIETEEGPQGSVANEVQKNYGISYVTNANKNDQKGANTQTWNWVKDMADIFTNLHAISNNSSTTIGGGPTTDWENRRAPMAPDFIERVDSVTWVYIYPTSALMAIDGIRQLKAEVMPFYVTNKNVNWSSSNSSVATVDKDGLVTAIAEGKATISVTTEQSNLSASFEIDVTLLGRHVIIPAKIEAEKYTDMNGIDTKSSGDTGGGLTVSYIEQGDWMDYEIHVPEAGNYTLDIRLASQNTGKKLFLLVESDTLATINVPKTGGWQTWQTVSAGVYLLQGNQTLRILAGKAVGFNSNINWLEIKKKTVNIKISTLNDLRVFPNPLKVGEPLIIEFDEPARDYSIKIYDIEGRLVQNIEKYNNDLISFDKKGVYVVSIKGDGNRLVKEVKVLVN